jgi:hypothetical protein
VERKKARMKRSLVRGFQGTTDERLMRAYSIRFVKCNEGLRDFYNLFYEFVWLPASLTDGLHIPCKTSEPLFQSFFGAIARIFRWSQMMIWHFLLAARETRP